MSENNPQATFPDVPDLEFVYTSMDDDRASFMIADLQEEYDRLYLSQRSAAPEKKETRRFPASVFSEADGGAWLLLISRGQAVAGGAMMASRDKVAPENAAEFKRVWSHPDFRRRGLVKFLLQELEAEAVRQGYDYAFMTTGAAQPKAIALYQQMGYTHWDVMEDGTFVHHAFSKPLTRQRAVPRQGRIG